jgi:hypothetical protein
MATSVKNPMHRVGQPWFKRCTHCNELFTSLGLSRHWDHCKSRPVNMTVPQQREQERRRREILKSMAELVKMLPSRAKGRRV